MKVLISGSARGIGRACCEKFLEMGHEVIGMDIIESTIAHARYSHIVNDIRDDLPEIADVNILINNAGVQNSGHDIDTNLKGTINMTEKYAFNPAIHSVLFMASASGRNGSEFPEYVASKGGMIAYMKNVAGRIAKYGATSNSISAGGVITELNAHILNDEMLYKAVLDETMLGKWASAEEIAQLAYFLTVINKSMTGEDILVDNGEMLKSNFIW